ncbi:MAG: type I-A CRISPR-associated protein Cas5a [Candidatus Nezhaarchaeota archaeon]|nr:type I-A CRISPR-associated protein Cas5a [Candidatus Nezhaarchaeota archaeon]
MKPSQLFFVKVHLDLHWGFASRHAPWSKSKDAFLIPPPTTFIGALAYGHARLFKRPEELDFVSYAEKVRENVASINISVASPLWAYSDLSRIWWYRRRERAVKFDAVALGKVVKGPVEAPSFTVVYLLSERGVKELGGEGPLVASAASIVRIGSKESIASVREVSYGHAELLSETRGATHYSLWRDLAEEVSGTYYAQDVVDYRKASIGDYFAAPKRLHIYPYDVEKGRRALINVKVKNGRAAMYDVAGELVVVEL